MTSIAKAFIVLLIPLGLLVGSSQVCLAETFEQPPAFDAGKLLGTKATGPNYRITTPVTSDGLLRIYTLETSYGRIRVLGDQLLRLRLGELAALNQLEKVSTSEAFTNALNNTANVQLKHAGEFIANPVGTIGKAVSGVGLMFNQMASNMNNLGKSGDNPVSDAIGVSTQKRQLAIKLGVDPYTDFDPLSTKLDQMALIQAAGAYPVSGGLLLSGIDFSNASTNKLGNMPIGDIVRDYTIAQILDLNRQRLSAMDVETTAIDALLTNKNYTPLDVTAMVAALDSMKTVEARSIFVARAAFANQKDVAYFMRRRAELLADYQAKTGALVRFVSLGGFPFNETREGKIVGVLPIDIISWTQNTSRAALAITDAIKRSNASGQPELRITGRATSLAKQRLKDLGWALVENAH